jgi:hypothetical protein
VTVDYVTADDSAVQPADYRRPGSLTFLPGDVSESISVDIVGDIMDENNETFLVNLANPTNGRFSDNQALGTISDDDLLRNIAETQLRNGDGATSILNRQGKMVRLITLPPTSPPNRPIPTCFRYHIPAGRSVENIHINVVGDTG